MSPNDRDDNDYDEGQDRRNYTDTQDRESYTICAAGVNHCACWYDGLDCCFCDGFPDCDYTKDPDL